MAIDAAAERLGTVVDVDVEEVFAALDRFGLSYGLQVKPRWWLLETFGAWWRRLRG